MGGENLLVRRAVRRALREHFIAQSAEEQARIIAAQTPKITRIEPPRIKPPAGWRALWARLRSRFG